MWSKILKEPVAFSFAIRALLLCAMAFGTHVTPEQLASVMVAVEAVLALFTRAAVTPIESLPPDPASARGRTRIADAVATVTAADAADRAGVPRAPDAPVP